MLQPFFSAFSKNLHCFVTCSTSTKIMAMASPAWAKDVHSKSKGVASLRSPEAASLPLLLQLAHRLIGDVESFGPSIEQMLETVQQGEMDLEMQVTVLQFALHCEIFFSTALFLVNHGEAVGM